MFTYALFKFGHDANHRAVYTHGNHKLEMVWSAVPGVLLILLGVGFESFPPGSNQEPELVEISDGPGHKQEHFLQLEVAASEMAMAGPLRQHQRVKEWQDHTVALRMPSKMPPQPMTFTCPMRFIA